VAICINKMVVPTDIISYITLRYAQNAKQLLGFAEIIAVYFRIHMRKGM